MVCFLLMCVVIVLSAGLSGSIPFWWAAPASSGALLILPLLIVVALSWWGSGESFRRRSMCLTVSLTVTTFTTVLVVLRLMSLGFLEHIDRASDDGSVAKAPRGKVSIEIQPGSYPWRLEGSQALLRIPGRGSDREVLRSQPGSILLATSESREFLVEPAGGWNIIHRELGDGAQLGSTVVRGGDSPLIVGFTSLPRFRSATEDSSARRTVRRLLSFARHQEAPVVIVLDGALPLLHPWNFDVAAAGQTRVLVPASDWSSMLTACFEGSSTILFINSEARRLYQFVSDGGLVHVIPKKDLSTASSSGSN